MRAAFPPIGPALLACLAGLALSCETGPSAAPGPPREALLAAERRAAAAADLLAERLGGELRAALEEGGPAAAIRVCATAAPRIAEEVSAETGVAIRRTALRTRNPRNAPDDFERATMQRWLSSDAEAITCCEVVPSSDGRELRWMRPIRLAPMCLVCHGQPEEIDPEVRAALARLYPDDRAVGFRVGDLRGAFSARVPLE